MKKIEVVFDQSQLTLDKGAQAVKDAVTAIRNALRAGTASTKSKGEVAGSNKKPWKQKGTGNARAGFRQSPVWRGGGRTAWSSWTRPMWTSARRAVCR